MSITKYTRLSALTLSVAAVVVTVLASASVASAQTSICPGTTWTSNLKMGNSSSNVMKLQQFLNMDPDTMIAASGVGSKGSETMYFGAKTKAAVNKFQAKYAADILTPTGLTTPTGLFGAGSRSKANALCAASNGSTPTIPGTSTTTPSASGVTVMAGAQPANGLAPANAARIPFTNFTVSASAGAPVTLNSVTVQRQGASFDASFSGVVLMDASTGVQIGLSKTLNSNHQATIGEAIVIPAGTTRTFTVAANRATAGAHGGEIASFAVVALNTSATVSGALPIVGASHTINETLSVGTVSTSTSSFDPGVDASRNIGDTSVRFSGIRFTAGSAEDIKLFSVRWRQTGSASGADVANLVTVVNGTSYPTTMSADGKYFTATFPNGILIGKGNSIDIYTQGDLVGSNSASRTLKFDIDKVTDVYFVGQLYGYGVAASGTYSPWFSGYTVTIQPGTVTTLAKANEVAAQNISVNVSNQSLGGFVTNFAGESVSVSGMTFTVASTTGSGSGLLTNVSVVDENGTVVAGPVDASYTSALVQTLTFTDSVTFPTGRHIYSLKGKVSSTIGNNGTYIVTVKPSTWTNATGQTSGNTISGVTGTSNFTLNTMTVKGAAANIALSASPTTQNIVAGVSDFVFANIQIDASQSGEDLRVNSLPINFAASAATTSLTGCKISDGLTALNTGSRVVNALTTVTPGNTFSFDNSLTVPKGTVKSLALSCNVSSSASGTFYFYADTTADNYTFTGVTSGNSITETITTSSSGTMTVTTSSLAVTFDSSSPSYSLAAGGTTGVTAGVIKLRATNEAVNLNKLGLKLTNSASSSSADLTMVKIYAGSNIMTTSGAAISAGTLIGTATFTGGNTVATSTFAQTVQLPKDDDATLVIKADIADIGTSQPGVEGHLVAIDPNSAEGTGSASGVTVSVGATAGVAGVRIYNTVPTIALDTVSSTGVSDGVLMKFKITADAKGSLGLFKLKFTVATTSMTLSSFRVDAYTDAAYATLVSGTFGSATGQFGSTTSTIPSGTIVFNSVTNGLQVPAGATYYLKLSASPAAVVSGSSAAVTLQGDSSHAALEGFMASTTGSVIGSSAFVWSPNATTTTGLSGNDWTNGYGVTGLPASGLIQTRSN